MRTQAADCSKAQWPPIIPTSASTKNHLPQRKNTARDCQSAKSCQWAAHFLSPLEFGDGIGNAALVPQVESQLCVTMLKALADQTRWSIVRELLKKPHTVGELSESLEVSHYNVSKHLRILRHAGMITTQKKGKSVECRVEESFRRKLSKDNAMLDLGCCSFRFKAA